MPWQLSCKILCYCCKKKKKNLVIVYILCLNYSISEYFTIYGLIGSIQFHYKCLTEFFFVVGPINIVTNAVDWAQFVLNLEHICQYLESCESNINVKNNFHNPAQPSQNELSTASHVSGVSRGVAPTLSCFIGENCQIKCCWVWLLTALPWLIEWLTKCYGLLCREGEILHGNLN